MTWLDYVSMKPLVSLFGWHGLGGAHSPWDDSGFSRALFDVSFSDLSVKLCASFGLHSINCQSVVFDNALGH